VPNLDRQLDALARDLDALDEAEARRELADVEARIAADSERASRLRLILHVKETWTTDIQIATPSGATVTVAAQNGRRPKTREAIMGFLPSEADEWRNVRAIRSHLRTLGIDISPEAVRQALRRLAAEGAIQLSKTTDGMTHYKLASQGGQTTLGADQQ